MGNEESKTPKGPEEISWDDAFADEAALKSQREAEEREHAGAAKPKPKAPKAKASAPPKAREEQSAEPAAEGAPAAEETPAGERYTTRRGRDVRLVPYDFRRPIQLSKGFVRSLSMVGETYSKLLTLSLSNYLRIPVNVGSRGVRQVIFEEYTRRIPNPSCINIIDIKPIKIPGILDVDLGLVFTMIEKLLGCHALTNDTRREFSAIEMRIARKIVQRMLSDFREAMLRILEVEVSLQGIEHNPDFTYIMNANDPCILMDFELELTDYQGDLTVCISLAGLDAELGVEGVSSYRDARSEEERDADQRRLQRVLAATRADVIAELGKVSLSFEELKRLREGSVISLRKQVQEPIVVRVGDSPVFHGKMGRYNKKNAVKITQVLVSELAMLKPATEHSRTEVHA